MSEDTAQARQLLADGDIKGLIRLLRQAAAAMAPGELAALLAPLGRAVGDQEVARTAEAVGARPDNARLLYELGYACVGSGIAFAAIPPLRAALELAPAAVAVRNELVTALEREERHREAAQLLEALPARELSWMQRYLLVFNLLMAGDADAARARFAQLGEPEDEQWRPAAQRVSAMMARLEQAAEASALDDEDLRGWQFVLGGTLLATLSPYGFRQGMRGRYAFVQDDYVGCRRTVDRLRLALEATGSSPTTVSLLPGRADRAFGLATAALLDLPTVPFAPGRPDTVVVGYDLTALDRDTAAALRTRGPGQLLVEQASCWTDPPAVAADLSGFLHQVARAPWDPPMRRTEEGRVVEEPADERSAEQLAELIVAARREREPGDADQKADGVDTSASTASTDGTADSEENDGSDGAAEPDEAEYAPDDSDAVFTAFARRVRGQWGIAERDRVLSCGPVRSSRFW